MSAVFEPADTAAAVVIAAQPPPPPPQAAAPAAPSPTGAGTSTGVPIYAALTIVVEMNRQFQLLDAKTTALTTEVASLKVLLSFALGAMAVLIAKDAL